MIPINDHQVMYAIKDFVEELISLTGMTGTSVAVSRYVSMIAVVIFLAWFADFFFRRAVVPLALRILSKSDAEWARLLFNRTVLTSACHILPAVVVWKLMPLVFFESEVTGEVLTRLTAVYMTVMTVRTSIVFINSFDLLNTERRSSTQQYFKTFRDVLKILMIFIAVIILVSIVINKSPMTLIAGLGATSAVLMLVFKDTIEGLVAGIRLTSNEMVHKGDWITVPKASADGTVEEITLTTVKVRNFDNTIVTVSPKTLVDDSFQNWIGMQESEGRRAKRKVYFDFRSIRTVTGDDRRRLVEKGYFTEKELKEGDINMALFRTYVEKYLAQRAEVNSDMKSMVRQLEATNTGLPVELYFFIRNKEWVVYEHSLADIMEHVYLISADFGLTIYQQYPEQ